MAKMRPYSFKAGKDFKILVSDIQKECIKRGKRSPSVKEITDFIAEQREVFFEKYVIQL